MAAAMLAKVERDSQLSAIDKTSASLCAFIPRQRYLQAVETTAWLARYQAFFGALPPDARNTWGRSRGALELLCEALAEPGEPAASRQHRRPSW